MDVSAFLMWTAEPKMMARKQAGFTGVLLLTILAVLLYLTNKRIWAPVKRAAKAKPAGVISATSPMRSAPSGARFHFPR